MPTGDAAPTGELMARALREAGGGPIFTLNGGHLWGLYLGAEKEGLRLVDVRHEQTAGFAAEAWAPSTRTGGRAAGPAGPGVTNAMSALAAARQNDSPVLFLGGRAPAARWGMGSLQEVDHLPLVASLTKHAATVTNADQAHRMTAEALAIARSRRTGPTFLDTPIDVFFQAGGEPDPAAPPAIDPGPEPDPDQVRRIAGLLRGADRPAIVVGGSVWLARAEEELVRLAEAAGAPVVLNGMARGLLPPEHPLFASRARAVALGEADLVVVIGVPLDFRLGFGQAPAIPDEARVGYVALA